MGTPGNPYHDPKTGEFTTGGGGGSGSHEKPASPHGVPVQASGGDTAKGGMAGGMKPHTPIASPVAPMHGNIPVLSGPRTIPSKVPGISYSTNNYGMGHTYHIHKDGKIIHTAPKTYRTKGEAQAAARRSIKRGVKGM